MHHDVFLSSGERTPTGQAEDDVFRKLAQENRQTDHFMDVEEIPDSVNYVEEVNPPSMRLSDGVLDLLSGMRIRLAGWDSDGLYSKGKYAEDLTAFQSLEKQETAWLRQLRKRMKERRGEDGLTPTQRNALNDFKENGGHACQLTKNTLNYITENGAILLLEARIREDAYALLGTISALSESPYTVKGRSLHRKTPNFDLRDLPIPDPAKEKAYETAKKRIVVWRTTVRKELSSADVGIELPEELEGLQLRRIGGGSLLKDALFRFSQMNEKELLTFNIGTVFNSEDPNAEEALLAKNEPSTKHNYWMHEWGRGGFRSHHDVLRSKKPKVYMFWGPYSGSLAEGLEAFEGEGGTLRRKGILDIPEINLEKTAETINQQVQEDVEERRRKSWN